MGHQRCGAAEAALSVVRDDAALPGSLGRMTEPIVPAVLTAQRQEGDARTSGAW
jgi:carbonic anhydrase